MIRDLVASFKNIKENYKLYLNFGLIYFLMASIIFVPFLSYFLNRLFLSVEGGVLLNLDVFKIVLTRRSLAGVSGMMILFILALLVLLGTYLIIAQKKLFNEEILVTEAMLTAMRAVPRLIGFEFLYLLLFIILLIPLVELQTNPLVRRFIEVPPTLIENLRAVRFGIFIYGVLLSGVAYFFIRWIFSFHEVFLERKSIRKSLKMSTKLTKGLRISILLKLLIVNVFLIGLFVMMIYLIRQVPGLLDFQVSRVVRQYFITFAGIALFLYMMILLPVNLFYLTKIYYEIKKKKGMETTDVIKTVQWKWLMRKEVHLKENISNKRVLLVLYLIVSGLVSFSLTNRVNEEFLYAGRNILVAAHRGDALNAPENSLSAIESALTRGASVIEMDIQMTRDGVLVLHHDTSLIRMAGVPEPVSHYTYDELNALEIGSAFDEAYKGEKIPTLREALVAVRGRGEVLLDVKVDKNREEVTRKILFELEDTEMKEWAYIQSFDYPFLREIRRQDREIRLGQIMYAAFGRLEGLDVDFYTVQINMLTPSLIRRAHEAGRGVFVWVVKDEEQLKTVLQYDIEGIITSDPFMVREMLGTVTQEEVYETGTEEEMP